MAEIFTPYFPGESQGMFNSAVNRDARTALGPAVSNPSAYGSVPAPVQAPGPTAGGNTATAIQLGQQAASQLPGYASSLGNIGDAIKSETAGQLPDDAIRQIEQTAAERGVAMGAPGSPNINADLLAAIGTNSLDLIQRGIGAFEGVVPNLPGYGISQNPGFYTTPQQVYDANVQNSVWAAAPNPSAAAAANLAAARGGANAGVGSVRPGQIVAPSYSPAPSNPMNPASGQAEGMYYGGVWYPTGSSPGSAGAPQMPGINGNPVDEYLKIANNYADTVSGGGPSGYNNPYDPLSLGDLYDGSTSYGDN